MEPGHSPRFVLLVWWITCLIWSRVWLCIKIGVGDVPTATFASARIVIALAALLLAAALRHAERVTAWQLSGLGLGLAGVAGVFADQLHVTGPAALWVRRGHGVAVCVALGYVMVLAPRRATV